MKTDSTLYRSLCIVTVSAALAFGGYPAMGQAATTDTLDLARADTRMFLDLEIRDSHLILIEGGAQAEGNVAGLAEHLREKGFNVVLSPDVENIGIPDLRLRSADLRLLAEALSIVTDNAVRATVRGQPPEIETLVILPGPGPRRAADGRRQVEVFNVEGYLRDVRQAAGVDPRDKQGVEAVQMEALQTVEEIIVKTLHDVGQGNFPGGHAPEFRFHPGTRLFIVIGASEAIDVARKIINALPGQPPPGTKFRPDLLEIPLPSAQE